MQGSVRSSNSSGLCRCAHPSIHRSLGAREPDRADRLVDRNVRYTELLIPSIGPNASGPRSNTRKSICKRQQKDEIPRSRARDFRVSEGGLELPCPGKELAVPNGDWRNLRLLLPSQTIDSDRYRSSAPHAIRKPFAARHTGATRIRQSPASNPEQPVDA